MPRTFLQLDVDLGHGSPGPYVMFSENCFQLWPVPLVLADPSRPAACPRQISAAASVIQSLDPHHV